MLVGPSGCGKSTTLRMVAGLEEISDGNIYIGDRLVNDVPPKDRDIAMVFQNYALYPHMDVYNNMAFGLKLRKFPKAEIDRRVKEAARMSRHRTPARPQAQGALRRPAPARRRGPSHRPRAQVFLMDEPLSNLDAKLRVQMRAGALEAAPAAADHRDLRHPRPDGSDDHGRPHRRDERRRHPAGGRPARDLRQSGQRVCRRLYRQPGR